MYIIDIKIGMIWSDFWYIKSHTPFGLKLIVVAKANIYHPYLNKPKLFLWYKVFTWNYRQNCTFSAPQVRSHYLTCTHTIALLVHYWSLTKKLDCWCEISQLWARQSRGCRGYHGSHPRFFQPGGLGSGYAHHLTICPPDFQTFLRPWTGWWRQRGMKTLYGNSRPGQVVKAAAGRLASRFIF